MGSNEISFYSNGTLHIDSITKEDEGMYKCNISNGIGNALIKTVLIKVIGMYNKYICLQFYSTNSNIEKIFLHKKNYIVLNYFIVSFSIIASY